MVSGATIQMLPLAIRFYCVPTWRWSGFWKWHTKSEIPKPLMTSVGPMDSDGSAEFGRFIPSFKMWKIYHHPKILMVKLVIPNPKRFQSGALPYCGDKNTQYDERVQSSGHGPLHRNATHPEIHPTGCQIHKRGPKTW